ncbi:hypothetical protein KC717_06315 [Candidatus Dojkabacteria bacterium]|uniref:Uncharacterized protein n=1 Tax=Candidatus Dojkabacteria bacterium TaxID=2099670 RepID=A0A955RLC7_9BACT|nr:hypothetical protein [Candidatus Dojkabacteria bacterium]
MEPLVDGIQNLVNVALGYGAGVLVDVLDNLPGGMPRTGLTIYEYGHKRREIDTSRSRKFWLANALVGCAEIGALVYGYIQKDQQIASIALNMTCGHGGFLIQQLRSKREK